LYVTDVKVGLEETCPNPISNVDPLVSGFGLTQNLASYPLVLPANAAI